MIVSYGAVGACVLSHIELVNEHNFGAGECAHILHTTRFDKRDCANGHAYVEEKYYAMEMSVQK